MFVKIGRSCARAKRERWLAAAAALGRDKNDASRCLRSVDRGRGCALQHLDAFDVVGVEVRDSVDGTLLTGHCDGGCTRRLRDAVDARRDADVTRHHTVHHIERIRRADERCDTAEANAIPATGRARVLLDLRASDFPLQRVLDTGRGNPCDVGGVHAGNRVRDTSCRRCYSIRTG